MRYYRKKVLLCQKKHLIRLRGKFSLLTILLLSFILSGKIDDFMCGQLSSYFVICEATTIKCLHRNANGYRHLPDAEENHRSR